MIIAITSGFLALTAAFLGQYLANMYTIKREKNKDLKIVYQELYSSTLNNLYAILDITLNFRRMHDLKINAHEDVYWDDLLRKVDNNLKYASSKVVSAYQEHMQYRYTEDLAGFKETKARLNIAISLLDDIYDAVVLAKIMDEDQIEKINYYRTIYLIWMYLLENICDELLVENAMKYHWIFEHSLFTKEFYESTKRRFQLAIDPEYFPNVFHEVLCNTVKSENEEIFESEVMSVFQKDGSEVIDYQLSMTKKERDNFLQRIYFTEIYTGEKFELVIDQEKCKSGPRILGNHNRLYIVEEYEKKFFVAMIMYWEDKGYIIKEILNGYIELTITAKGIDYIESDYSRRFF